ncbi:carbohydrate kinase [Pelagibius sp. Alg239-R121]|uniref:carbohydrate kinase family protein n=1 Tax=Pelagibius sp. Alg239-R121 TaxID=2993448 RepID=UPI0024A74DBE|nr:carbohydrate kinase [Pelagibius sp. Alg239-R121]
MIVVAGESLIDFVHRPQISADASSGPLYEACPGGSPFNCAIALGRLEIDVGFLCPLSNDSLGGLLTDRLQDSNVRLLQSDPVTAPTSLAVVSLSTDGSPSYSFYRQGTADRQLNPGVMTRALSGSIEAFQIGSLALIEKDDGPSWSTALQAAVGHGALISIDPNVRTRLIKDHEDYQSRLTAMLTQADMIKASDEDLEYLYPGLPPEDAIQRAMADHGITLTVLTRGREGATAFTSSGMKVARPAASFTDGDPGRGDSIGAGDSFQAGLLAWLKANGQLSKSRLTALGEEQLAQMLDFASTVAGLNCAETGCNPPTLEQVREARSG